MFGASVVARFKVGDEHAGKRTKCPACSCELKIPNELAIHSPEVDHSAPKSRTGHVELDRPEDWPLPETTSAPAKSPGRVAVDSAYIRPQAVATVTATEPSAEDRHSGAYVYHMVQIPRTVAIQEGESHAGKASAYVQGFVNQFAAAGWEFYRMDGFGIRELPGCFGAFFGARSSQTEYYVVTFRKPA